MNEEDKLGIVFASSLVVGQSRGETNLLWLVRRLDKKNWTFREKI
jgi:hypothetical protein